MKPTNFNPGKMKVFFWMICVAVFFTVGMMGIKRWSDSKPLPETKRFVVNHDGRGYFFTSKEAADQFEFVAKLNEDGITQANWQNSYLRLVRELRSENARLKKRVEELESGNWVKSGTTNYVITQDDLRRTIESVYPPLAEVQGNTLITPWAKEGYVYVEIGNITMAFGGQVFEGPPSFFTP